eukprot:354188-Chlamydomonas_euryale.AAC.3
MRPGHAAERCAFTMHATWRQWRSVFSDQVAPPPCCVLGTAVGGNAHISPSTHTHTHTHTHHYHTRISPSTPAPLDLPPAPPHPPSTAVSSNAHILLTHFVRIPSFDPLSPHCCW